MPARSVYLRAGSAHHWRPDFNLSPHKGIVFRGAKRPGFRAIISHALGNGGIIQRGYDFCAQPFTNGRRHGCGGRDAIMLLRVIISSPPLLGLV